MGKEAESAWVQTGKPVVGYSIESLAKLNPRLSAETVMELYEMLLERFRKIISLGLDSNEITGVFREIDFNFAIYDSDFASYRTVCSVTRTSPDTGNEYMATCTLNEPGEYMLSVFARDSNRNNAAKSVRFTVGEGGSGGGGSGGRKRITATDNNPVQLSNVLHKRWKLSNSNILSQRSKRAERGKTLR
jgi:hypothetical protein